MNYSFPRKKPSSVPKIIVTPEYLAKGSLKKSYINTRLAFNVPWMGVVAMAFAKYPFFYNALWQYIHPLTKSIEFDELSKKLVIISNILESESKNLLESFFFKLRKCSNNPVALSSGDISANFPPMSVRTQPG